MELEPLSLSCAYCIKLSFDADSFLGFSYLPKSPATFLSQPRDLKGLKNQFFRTDAPQGVLPISKWRGLRRSLGL